MDKQRYVLRFTTLDQKIHDIIMLLSNYDRGKLVEELSKPDNLSVLLYDEDNKPHIIRERFLNNCRIKLYLHPQQDKYEL